MNRKHLLLSLCLALLCASPGIHAEVINLSSGERTTTGVPAAPDKKVEKGDNWISVTYTFSEAALMEDTDFPGTFLWKYPGFGNTITEGKPAVPCRADRFIIPEGCTANVEITNSVYKDFQIELAPSTPLQLTTKLTNEPATTPMEAYNGVYPAEITADGGVQTYRGTDILNVNIFPIQYSYTEKTVRAYSQITYRINFDDAPMLLSSNSDVCPYIAPTDAINDRNTYIRLNDDDDEISTQSLDLGGGGITINPGMPINGLLFQTYLILTTTEMRPAAEKLAEWKKRMGFTMLIETADSWTYDEVNNKIKEIYTEHPALYYVLLIGDHTVVPAKRYYYDPKTKYSTYDYYSDNEYYCMDGDEDIIPDVHGARIPVASLEKALDVVNKTIEYEYNPSSDINYLSSAVMAARFQDDNYDGYEDVRFVLTTEEIKEYISDKYSTIKRFYSHPQGSIPTHWNKGQFSFGEKIPEELNIENFDWEERAEYIIRAINEGCSLLYYYGHGATNGWFDPYFMTEYLPQLNNKSKYPIYLGVICYNGRYEIENNFIRNLLGMKDAGCVAAIGGTDQSRCLYDDVLMTGLFDAIWPEPGLYMKHKYDYYIPATKAQPVYSIGEIFHSGMNRVCETYVNADYNEYFRQIQHVFGDPSLMPYWTDGTTAYASNKIQLNSMHLVIDLKKKAYVSVYNSATDMVYRYFTDSFMMPNPDASTTSVYVTYPGEKPKRIISGGYTPTSSTSCEISSCQLIGGNTVKVNINGTIDNNSTSLQVRDTYGNIRLTEEISDDSNPELDVSSLNQGIYVVSLVENGSIVSSKHFVK